MGAGIAQVAACAGWAVSMRDTSAERVYGAIESITAQLRRLADKGRMKAEEANAAVQRLCPMQDTAEFAACELVIEAVAEDLHLKSSLLREVAESTPCETILATNTSSLSIATLAQAIHAEARTVGMHFFNPVPLLPLVECVRGDERSAWAVDRVYQIAREWGKTPVRCRDTPGFIVNRVARGYYLEPLRLLGEGVAGIDEIDQTLTRLAGFRMGPFALMDLIGIDVNFAVTRSVWEQLGRPARLAPHPLQEQLFNAGHFGRKTRRGAYSYDQEPPLPALVSPRRTFELPPAVYEAVRRFCDGAVREAGSITEQYIVARTLGAIINEAALALDDGIATADDIDTAMKLGTNYPHGPIEWAGKIGRHTCRHLLAALNHVATDHRFTPARWLAQE